MARGKVAGGCFWRNISFDMTLLPFSISAMVVARACGTERRCAVWLSPACSWAASSTAMELSRSAVSRTHPRTVRSIGGNAWMHGPVIRARC